MYTLDCQQGIQMTEPWESEYQRGWNDQQAGQKDTTSHRYDGPYRLGWFEASEQTCPPLGNDGDHVG